LWCPVAREAPPWLGRFHNTAWVISSVGYSICYFFASSANQGLDVPLRAILETEYGPVFEPEDIPKLEAAYEAALRKLGQVDRKGARTLTVAKLIIGLAKDGEQQIG
jgi:hypothetical protein